jgi:hypothetical protein
VGRDYEKDILECRAAIGKKDGLAVVAHITAGTFDFAMARSRVWPGGDALTPGFERAGQQLGLAMNELSAACEAIDGTALIRMVVQGDRGALFQVVKVAGQTLFGMTFDGTPEAMDRADRQLVELADSAARRIGAVSMQWGGFRIREDSGDLWRPYATLPTGEPATPYVTVTDISGIPESAARSCRDLLHLSDLHHVSIYRHSQLIWQADIFDDPSLSPFFQRVTPDARRRGYDRLVRQVSMQARRFRQTLALVHSEQVTRLVLDVARGAIFALPLGNDLSVVGGTLVQTSSRRTDKKLRALREPLRAALRVRSAARE